MTPQFLHTFLALPGLLCLRHGGHRVAVGPQDADGGGREVREGLLALLLPPTALLPRVAPSFLITVPALRETRREVKSAPSDEPRPSLTERIVRPRCARCQNPAWPCAKPHEGLRHHTAALAQKGPKPAVLLPTHLQTPSW